MLALIGSLQETETKPAGLDGREETDAGIIKLTSELERLWRATMEDVAEFDTQTLCGDWELVYGASSKFRRWQSVLNSGNNIPKGQFQSLVQNFSAEEGSLTNDYDMEE